jgi:DNA-binding XRE family transcriptional regulator
MTDNLGQKIKKYRTRAGMSQMELELAIGASAGSVSRIEGGRVNPSKETMLKFIEILDLNIYEVVDLLGIENYDVNGLLESAKKLYTS